MIIVASADFYQVAATLELRRVGRAGRFCLIRGLGDPRCRGNGDDEDEAWCVKTYLKRGA
jgi:hypothetical protein